MGPGVVTFLSSSSDANSIRPMKENKHAEYTEKSTHARDTESACDLGRSIGEDVVDDEIGGFVGDEALKGVDEEIEGLFEVFVVS